MRSARAERVARGIFSVVDVSPLMELPPEVEPEAPVVLLPVPLAPMLLVPDVPVPAAVEPLVLPVALGVLDVLGELDVLGVLGVLVELEPRLLPLPLVPAPVAPVVPEVPAPLVEPPEVWATANPPMARAAAAASVVRVFLVVVISNSLNGTPKGMR